MDVTDADASNTSTTYGIGRGDGENTQNDEEQAKNVAPDLGRTESGSAATMA